MKLVRDSKCSLPSSFSLTIINHSFNIYVGSLFIHKMGLLSPNTMVILHPFAYCIMCCLGPIPKRKHADENRRSYYDHDELRGAHGACLRSSSTALSVDGCFCGVQLSRPRACDRKRTLQRTCTAAGRSGTSHARQTSRRRSTVRVDQRFE